VDLKLAGKRALVTGGSSGIGRSIAETLAREGVIVVVHGRDDGRLRIVADGIRREGGEAFTVTGEMLNQRDVECLAQEAITLTGGIDILVNNAGGRVAEVSHDFFATTADDWLDTYRVNVTSCLTLAQRLAVGMMERNWGRIVNISSAAGSFVRPKGKPAYSASKAALNSMTLSLANAVSGSGVSVVSVSPGPILTPALESFIRNVLNSGITSGLDFAEAERRAAREYFQVPLDRLGRPDEIAAVVAVLVSPFGGFCNGTNVHLDGGSIGTIN
jgi:NAD(P)-dependent dehydrogenase (short-subunit alcohol dehydrogenase family)